MFRVTYNTDRLMLIKLSNDLLDMYIDHTFDMYSNKEIMQYSGFGNVETEDELKQLLSKYLKKEDFYLWIIKCKSEEKFIGDISLNVDINHNFASVACFLHYLYWGNGYMKEAMKELLFSAFAEFGLHRIEAQIHINNYRSIRFFERFGFKFEGCLRQNFLINGTFYDSKMYSLLFDEFIEMYANR